MTSKTKSTLKWQTKGQNAAKATFRDDDDTHWPSIEISLDSPECPTRQRLIKERDEARKLWSKRYAHALVNDKELPDEEEFPYPDRCLADCEGCSSTPHEGWKITFCWWPGSYYDYPDYTYWPKPNNKVEALGKAWGQTDPLPKLTETTWVFDDRKAAQAKAEEIATSRVDEIAAWIAPIVAAKQKKADDHTARCEAKRQAIDDKLAANVRLLGKLEHRFHGLEGVAQVDGIRIENPERLLED